MTLRSLRLRLAVAASCLIALALVLAGLGLVVIFDRVLDARTADDLDRTAKYLAGQVALSPQGAPSIASEPPDPRFAMPYGGLYWQIAGPEGRAARSRSLWDKGFDGPRPDAGGEAMRVVELAGPDRARLIAVVRHVGLERAGREVPLTVTVAMDRRDLEASRSAYLASLVPSLALLGLVLALAMWVFVQKALAPLQELREDLAAIHRGERATLPVHFPDEVQPLVDDLNRLIAARERALDRARKQAGDMAHGLKTPLAVLSALARRIGDERPDVSRELDEQSMAMSRQVERSLARARVAAGADLRRLVCPVAPVVERLVGTLRRLPDGDSLSWSVSIAPDLAYPAEEGDLTELLGNILDNARKWAHRRVLVSGTRDGSGHLLAVEDDGPGMSPEAMSRIARGQRWDETMPGTGFGIAISSDIARETGAALDLGRSELGGLKVTLGWQRQA